MERLSAANYNGPSLTMHEQPLLHFMGIPFTGRGFERLTARYPGEPRMFIRNVWSLRAVIDAVPSALSARFSRASRPS